MVHPSEPFISFLALPNTRPFFYQVTPSENLWGIPIVQRARIAPSLPFLSEIPTLQLPGWPSRVYTKGMLSWGLQRAGASHKSLYCHSLSLRVTPFPPVVVFPSLESQILVTSTVAFLETRKTSVREVGQWSLQLLFLKVYLEDLLDPGRRMLHCYQSAPPGCPMIPPLNPSKVAWLPWSEALGSLSPQTFLDWQWELII